MIKVRNIFRDLPKRTGRPAEHIEEILSDNGVVMERIVTYGKPTPEGIWYDDPRNEFVILLHGEAELLFEEGGQRIRMEKGDFINIPPHARHRVEKATYRMNTVWLTVYYENGRTKTADKVQQI